jgi:DNA-binding response OmpR family regulator
MRLLVVEDDDIFGAAVERHLSSTGHVVEWVRSVGEIAAALSRTDYDGVLLDLGLPDGFGETSLRTIKANHPGLPVVVMTARGAIRDRIQLLDIGADDYMVKPLDLDELAARLRAVARRKRAAPEAEVELRHGALTLLPSRRAVTWHGEPVQLTNKEYLLLEHLLRRKNQVLTRAQLEATLFDDSDDIGSNALEVYIHFLRRKFSNRLIQTVRGVGYQLGEATRFNE